MLRLGAYISGSRNIKHKTDLDSRCRFLKQGRLQVVSHLSSLPPTKHDLTSFAVDLTLFTVSKTCGISSPIIQSI